MPNIAAILILVLLAVTFIQSGYDKISDWKGNIEWLKGHFSQTPLRNQVPAALMFLLILEIIAGILCISGCVENFLTGGRTLGLYGAIVSCVSLIIMLFGQRLAKDYDGARTIVIYFIPAVAAVYWLS